MNIIKTQNNITILIILGGLKREGITNSVLSYLETMDKTGLNIALGVAGKYVDEQMSRARAINIPIFILPERNNRPFQYFCTLIKLVRKENFKIVHVHGNSATLAIDMLAAMLGGASVRIAHSRNTSCTHRLADKVFRPLFNFSYTDGFSCGIDAGKWLFGNRKFTVIPNGKKISKYLFNQEYRNNIRGEFGFKDETIVLGHVGVFNKQKNHSFLIDIFSDLLNKSENYVLCLFGIDGGELKNIQEKIELLGIKDKVYFMGYKADIYKYMSAMDVMVFPSLYEGLPNVVIEWQMCGLPCVISNTITKECCVMPNVYRLPIDKGTFEWVQSIFNLKLYDRNCNKEIVKEMMANAGYDIDLNAELLKQKYLELGAK